MKYHMPANRNYSPRGYRVAGFDERAHFSFPSCLAAGGAGNVLSPVYFLIVILLVFRVLIG